MDKIKNKLKDYQVPHFLNIVNRIKKTHIHIDSSDTGVGKTYIAIACAKYLNYKLFVICPKTIINNWYEVSEKFNIEPLVIVNYETLIKGKCYRSKTDMSRKKCKYLTYDKITNNYYWNLPDDVIVIFDEVHRCSNNKSQHCKLLLSLQSVYNSKHLLLLLSSTISDNVNKFMIFGILLKLYSEMSKSPEWMLNKKYNPKKAKELIFNEIYPKFASKISIENLGDNYPKRQITTDCYSLDNYQEINDEYNIIHNALIKLKDKVNNDGENHFVKIIRARQKIELLKIPIFTDITEQYLDNNYSVVIFVNFTDTLLALKSKFKTNCVIYGKQTITERLKNIKDFNCNKKKIIICNIESGGESISLDDTNGNNPRVSLISPTWSKDTLLQILGRTHRANTKSISLNKIIYCAGTVEEKICSKLRNKLSDISTIKNEDIII